MLAKDTQQQYEEAYVNKELMNKYLQQNLAQQGLANTGIANLYAQQNNTNYLNNRAEIANANMQKEQELYDAYTNAVQEKENKKQAQMYDLAINKVNNSIKDGYLSDQTRMELEDYFTNSGLGENYMSLINQYMDSYVPTSEQKKTLEYQPYYDIERERVTNELNSLLEKTTKKLNKANLSKAYQILEKNKELIGEDNYLELLKQVEEHKMTDEDIKLLEELERQQMEQAYEFQKESDWYDAQDSTLEKYAKYALSGHQQNINNVKDWWENIGGQDFWNSIVRLFSNKK